MNTELKTPRIARINRLKRTATSLWDMRHMRQLVQCLTASLRAKDEYTYKHSRRVAEIAAQIGNELGFPAETLGQLHLGGLLHDIGKIGVDDRILQKEDVLNDDEFEDVKQHPRIGCIILENIEPLKSIIPIVRHHHERYDGKGYPDRLIGDQIPFEARVVAVADSFDAMTSDRSYRAARSFNDAIKILSEGADTQWDGRIVNAFLKIAPKVAAAFGLQAHKPIPHFRSPASASPEKSKGKQGRKQIGSTLKIVPEEDLKNRHNK